MDTDTYELLESLRAATGVNWAIDHVTHDDGSQAYKLTNGRQSTPWLSSVEVRMMLRMLVESARSAWTRADNESRAFG